MSQQPVLVCGVLAYPLDAGADLLTSFFQVCVWGGGAGAERTIATGFWGGAERTMLIVPARVSAWHDCRNIGGGSVPCSISEQSTRACSVLCAANSLCCCPAALLSVWNILLSTNCTQLPNCHDVNSQLTVRGYLTVTMSTLN